MDFIKIRGAREHNLKNINIDIPKNKLVVITGVSGSGKSSLAFDTIYAEGQRRYVESLSSYARQFLGVMKKPEIDQIEGLSPAISIDQKSVNQNPRSTVGTVTEIYDFLRLLFARVGHPHCPNCHRAVQAQSVEQIVKSILKFSGKVLLLSPVVKKRKGTYEELFRRLYAKGFVRVRVDNEIMNLEEEIILDKYKIHNIEIVVDRLLLNEDFLKNEENIKRVTDSVETALNLSKGEIIVSVEKNGVFIDNLFSENFNCPYCNISFDSIQPHSFSFNSPYGACKLCNGLGFVKKIDKNLIYNPRLSISQGGIYPWSRLAENAESWNMKILEAVAKKYNFSLRKPIGELGEKALNLIFYGTGDERYKISYKSIHNGREGVYFSRFEGIINNLERRYMETQSDFMRSEIEKYMREIFCERCKGKRLRDEALAVTIKEKNIYDVSSLTIDELKKWIENLNEDDGPKDNLTSNEKIISSSIVKEIKERTEFLISVGLNYLTLSRPTKTLSGGELQRIRLASQIGSGLSGVLYVLDEPSIGLHQRDNIRLISTLKRLRDLKNTVIVVEHDEETIRSADFVIDIGIGAGEHGGKVVAKGKIDEIIKCKESLTGQFLSKAKQITKENILKSAKKIIGNTMLNQKQNRFIKLTNVVHNNLKGVNLTVPLSKFVAITGVSGSGKSSLISETLYPVLMNKIYGSKIQAGSFEKIEGIEFVDKVVNIDQSPIGRTPRSNPATYTGVFAPIRELFSLTKESKQRGYGPGRFSFNVKRGRCNHCNGDGIIKIEMQFLPDIYVPCELCNGKRYNKETLQIDFNGKNIADVLNMTVEEALSFFKNINKITNKLQTLFDVGLGYIKLGQSSTTLSGGEAQRIKLASELSKRSTGKTVYILDEPTTGLHFADIEKLLIILHSLVLRGNTVIVIEHNLEVIKTADWVIDLGPEGGLNGGKIIAEGTIDDIIKQKESYTGRFLKKIM